MIETITQETIRVILPSKVALAVEEIARRNGTDPAEELPRFYASGVYRALENEKSKFWWFSPAELCDIYQDEVASREEARASTGRD
ncbi:MAG: hypothetical protein IK077_16350 [Thermoguttaceae bacterium]|nr:hypothetical protein [Thermoguttaceae bacterium]